MAQIKKSKNEMSFLEHLEDLRWHIIRIVLVIFALSIYFLFNRDVLFEQMIFAIQNPDFPTYRFFCFAGEKLNISALCITPEAFQLQPKELTSQFMLYIKMSFACGFILSFPYILWEIWRFVRPALYKNEIKNLGGIVFISAFLFYIGAFFGYFLLAPLSINFLVGFQLTDSMLREYSIDSFLSILSGMVLWSGVMFEIPMIAYFLAKLGFLGKNFMATNRKYAFVVSLILAAIITPSGDVFSLSIVAAPLWALYEVSILVVSRVERKKRIESV
jgi:sec-independent protein translocase protein TatC